MEEEEKFEMLHGCNVPIGEFLGTRITAGQLIASAWNKLNMAHPTKLVTNHNYLKCAKPEHKGLQCKFKVTFLEKQHLSRRFSIVLEKSLLAHEHNSHRKPYTKHKKTTTAALQILVPLDSEGVHSSMIPIPQPTKKLKSDDVEITEEKQKEIVQPSDPASVNYIEDINITDIFSFGNKGDHLRIPDTEFGAKKVVCRPGLQNTCREQASCRL